jgi:tRNA A37 methylthiotransferase MiaB
VSIHLQKFVDRVRGFEARGAREFTMSIQDANDLHADITRLLLDLQNLREALSQQQSNDQAITVRMDGGTF